MIVALYALQGLLLDEDDIRYAQHVDLSRWRSHLQLTPDVRASKQVC